MLFSKTFSSLLLSRSTSAAVDDAAYLFYRENRVYHSERSEESRARAP